MKHGRLPAAGYRARRRASASSRGGVALLVVFGLGLLSSCATTSSAGVASGNLYDAANQKLLNVMGKTWSVPADARFVVASGPDVAYVGI